MSGKGLVSRIEKELFPFPPVPAASIPSQGRFVELLGALRRQHFSRQEGELGSELGSGAEPPEPEGLVG